MRSRRNADEKLVELLVDRKFLTQLKRAVFQFLQHEADDIVADAICDLLSWTPPAPLEMWQARLAAYRAVRRHAGRRYLAMLRSTMGDDMIEQFAAPETSRPDHAYFRGAYVADRINAALAELPPTHAAAWSLSVVEEMSGEEIALQLGVQHVTVRTWLWRARQRLAPKLEDLRAA